MADDGAGECHVAKLPQGLLHLVLSRLPGRDAAISECVHPSWRSALDERDLWIQMAKRDWLVTDEEIRVAGIRQDPPFSQSQRDSPRRAGTARGGSRISRCSAAVRASASGSSSDISPYRAGSAENTEVGAAAAYSGIPADSASNFARAARALYGAHYFSYRRYGPFYPRARRVWHVMRTWLRAHIPDLDATLLAGASEQQLDEAEAALGVTFPAAMRALYRVCDGQMPRYDKMVVEVRGEQRRRRGTRRGRRAHGGGREGARGERRGGSGTGATRGANPEVSDGRGGGAGNEREEGEEEAEGEAMEGIESPQPQQEEGEAAEEEEEQEEEEEEEEDEEDEEAAVASIFHGLLGSYSFYDHWVSTRLLPLRRIVAGSLQIRTRVAASAMRASRTRAGGGGGGGAEEWGLGRGGEWDAWPLAQILIGASFNYAKLFFLDCSTGMVTVGGSDVLHACAFLPCLPPSRPSTCPNPLASELPLAIADEWEAPFAGLAGWGGAGAGESWGPGPGAGAGAGGGGGGVAGGVAGQGVAVGGAVMEQLLSEACGGALPVASPGASPGASTEPSAPASASAAASAPPLAGDGMLRWLEEYSSRLSHGWYGVRPIVDDIPAKGICLFPESAPLCSMAVTRGVCVRASALLVPEVAPLVLPRPAGVATPAAAAAAAVAAAGMGAGTGEGSGGAIEEAGGGQAEADGRGGRRRARRARRVVGTGGGAGGREEDEEEEEGQRCFAYSVRMKLLPLDQPQESHPDVHHTDTSSTSLPSLSTPISQPDASAIDMSACQLRSRHWVIKEEGEVVAEVRGDAVVGEYPILRRGEGEFVYQSCSQMTGQWGSIEGDFTFVPGSLMRPTGAEFDAVVAPFPLQVPDFVF